MVEFTNTAALVLLGLIPVAIYLARHSLAALSRPRARASITARVMILLLIVLALAGLRIRLATRDLAVIFLVDVSSSVAPGAERAAVEFINGEIDRAAPRDYVGIVAFGRDPSVELAPSRKETLGEWHLAEINAAPARDYTDIATALRLAAALVPEDAAGRLVLISDGNENLESAAEEAQLLRAAGIEVHARAMTTVSDAGDRQAEVAVRDLAAPQSLAEGEAFDLRVTIDSTTDTDAVLRVFRNDSIVAERPVRLAASGENVFVMPQRNERKGFYTYRAEVEAVRSDIFVQNNSREAFTIVEGRPKTLYVYGDGQPPAGLRRVLEEGSFAADIRSSAALPTTLAGFQDYDLVIFDNVPATGLTTGQMKMIQSYVRDLGGGFIMVGGDQSFGPGGYYKTPVEETLPVSLDVRQKKHFPSLALALVIDKSGSMSGTKMKLALEAASAAVDFLSDRDSVAVVAFDSDAQTVVNLGKVEDKQAILREIGSIQEGGGTEIYAGLQRAYEMLQPSDAQIKHIILLSDGQSEGDFPGLTRSIREAGITLSSVAVGDDADFQLMKALAEWGGGRFYQTDSPENLPRIFTREAFLASRSTIIEEPFTPRLVRPSQATDGIDWSSAPRLGGYVGTAERDALTTPAITSLVTDKDDPLYAAWQYGLGRAAAFTSDAKPRWALGWMNWSGFGQFWAQALRDTLRREGATDLTPRVDIDAGRGRIAVEAVTPDGAFKNNLRLRAHIVAPDFSTSDVTLEQTAAGHYETEFEATRRGAYLVSVTEEGGEAAPITGSVNSYSPEYAVTTSDTSLLARLAEATGGRVLAIDSSDANLFERGVTRTRPQEIWQWLLVAALLLLPIDVGIRRVHITREQMLAAREWIASKLRRQVAAEGESEAAAALSQLKDARARVRMGNDGTESPARASHTAQPAAPATSQPGVNRAQQRAAETEREQVGSEAGETKPLASRLLDARRKKRD
jgi:Ca-activated chloride channel homolog